MFMIPILLSQLFNLVIIMMLRSYMKNSRSLQMLLNKEFLSDCVPTKNGHGKVLNSLDQEGKHLKFTLYFAVKLIAVVRI